MKNYKRITLYIFISLLVFSLSACKSNSNINSSEPKLGSISGRVYFDENSNEICDCECGIEDIKIRLYPGNCGGSFQQTAISDEEGYYTFSDLEFGSYCIYPDISHSCEGFTPTAGINRKVELTTNETVEVEWFSYELYFQLGND